MPESKAIKSRKELKRELTLFNKKKDMTMLKKITENPKLR
jgi:hypothetical protein